MNEKKGDANDNHSEFRCALCLMTDPSAMPKLPGADGALHHPRPVGETPRDRALCGTRLLEAAR